MEESARDSIERSGKNLATQQYNHNEIKMNPEIKAAIEMKTFDAISIDTNCEICKGNGAFATGHPMMPTIEKCWKCYKDYSKDPSGLELLNEK